MISPTWLEILLIIGIMTLAGTVQAATGAGLSLVAVPPLVLIDPDFVPLPILIAGLLISTRHIVVEGAHIQRTTLAIMIACRSQ